MPNKLPGDSVTIQVTIENIGNVDLGVGVRISGAITGILILPDQAGAVNVGGSQVFTFSDVVPDNVTPGNYPVIAELYDDMFSVLYDSQAAEDVVIGTVTDARIVSIVVS